MSALAGRTIIVTGASRGIGRAIALRAAADGANLVIAAKSDQPHPKLPGTIHTVAAEVEAAAGRALPLAVDVRSEDDVRRMAAETVRAFGGIDCLVNNAGAISLTSTADTPPKRYDLLQQINVRAVFLCASVSCASAALAGSAHPESVPAALFRSQVAGAARGVHDFEVRHDALHAGHGPRICPRRHCRQLALAADDHRHRGDRHADRSRGRKMCRTPQIVADAAYRILCTSGLELTGQTLLDEDVLRQGGVTDFSVYACAPGERLQPDLFVD